MNTTATLRTVPFSSSVCVGDVVPVRVTVSVDGEPINAAQGTLVFDPSEFRIESVSIGGSVFRIWPKTPVIGATNGTVSFVGGLPTPGYDGDGGLLFTVNVIPLKADGDAAITWQGTATVLLNDGAGSPAAVVAQGASLNVSESTASICASPRPTPEPFVDTTPPEPFDLIITRTDDAFRGDYFASFYAYDSGSGIDRYEVRENGASWHREQSPYVLERQEGNVLLEVKAVDVAGNERIASTSAFLTRSGGMDFGPWWFWLIVALAVGAGLTRWLQKRRVTDIDSAKIDKKTETDTSIDEAWAAARKKQ